jgi:hypothetical protein
MILSSLNPEEVGARLSLIKGFLRAVVAHIKPVARLAPEKEAAEVGNWQLESEKTAEVRAKEAKEAAKKAERLKKREEAEMGMRYVFSDDE